MLYRTILKMSFLPPLLNILLILIGLLVMSRYRRLGALLCLSGVLSLYALSTFWVSNGLLARVEVSDVVSPQELELLDPTATALVVLGAGHSEYRAEYGGPWPDSNAALRLNYAATLHRLTGLPLMTTGGQPADSQYVHARVMETYLQRLFGAEPRWVEGKSRTTEENAEFAAAILARENIHTVLLVTQSVHMRRAVLLFEAQGLRVIAAPTQLSNEKVSGIHAFLPSPVNLVRSYMVMHEQLGYLWYRLVGVD